METSYGLTEYVGEQPKRNIHCVLKRLYSDFIVLEVLPDKSIVELKQPRDVASEFAEQEDGLRQPNPSAEKPGSISDDSVTEMDGLLASGDGKKKINLPIEPAVSKDDRRAIHAFIRARYHEKLISEMSKDGASIEVKYCGYFTKNNSKRWTQGQPDYLHFTLAKENKDTGYALGVLAKLLNMKTNAFKTSGNKDRRAVTAQRVSVYRVDKARVASINAKARGFLMYDFEYRDDELRAGSHWGNRFEIVLRDINPADEAELTERLQQWADKGFINYFGTQRFGSCGTGTADVGRLILQRKWKEAVEMILGGARYGSTVADAVRVFRQTGDAYAAKRELKGAQEFASIEGSLLTSLAKGNSWQAALLALPRQSRSLYVHAYQSLLWNKVASRRIRENAASVEGDVDDKMQPLPVGSPIQKVALPLPCFNEEMADSYIFRQYDELMAVDEISRESFKSLEDRYSLGEHVRLLVKSPEELQWEFVRFEQPGAQLQRAVCTNPVPESELGKGDHLALKMQFNLESGVYATTALREITGADMGKRNMKTLEGVKEEGDENGAKREHSGEEEEPVEKKTKQEEEEEVKEELQQ